MTERRLELRAVVEVFDAAFDFFFREDLELMDHLTELFE